MLDLFTLLFLRVQILDLLLVAATTFTDLQCTMYQGEPICIVSYCSVASPQDLNWAKYVYKHVDNIDWYTWLVLWSHSFKLIGIQIRSKEPIASLLSH